MSELPFGGTDCALPMLYAIRREREVDAFLISIADPSDPGMLDVVGFDAATPALIADFARGSL